MEVEVIAAIGTHQQTGKHIAFPIVGTALAYLPSLLLDLLPHGAVNDRLMHILENDPVFTVILDPLFVLIGLAILSRRESPTTVSQRRSMGRTRRLLVEISAMRCRTMKP